MLGFLIFTQQSLSADEINNPLHHREQGLIAAKQFPGYANLCDLTVTFKDVNSPNKRRTGATSNIRNNGAQTTKRSNVPEVAATQVFDNLYFLGNRSVSAWLLGDEQGYILIDALTSDEAARETIIGGMHSLGLDPKNIRYLLITHAHGDHYGGHRYLTETLNVPILMSESDWALAKRTPVHPRFGPAPAQGRVVGHGEIIKAGNTELEIRLTPGHTLGTISPIFTVYDQGTPYQAALWGGTGFNFGARSEQFKTYADSAKAFKTYAQQKNITVFLSNHGRRDGAINKLRSLAKRKTGEPHPFVLGSTALEVYDLLSHCALAQYYRIKQGDAQAP